VDDTPNPYDLRKNMKDYQYVVRFKVTKQLKGTYASATFAVLVHEPNETFDLRGAGQRIPYRIFLDASGKRMIQKQFALDNR